MSTTFEFTVPKLACAVCVGNVTKAVQEIDANADIAADPKTKLVAITPSAAFSGTESSLKEVLTAAGYPPA